MSERILSYLPVPDITEELSHTFKQFKRKDDSMKYLKRPPKLYPKSNSSFNRTSTPHAISFKEYNTSRSHDSLLGSVYCKDIEETYFDQCFEQISKIGEGSFGEVFKVKSKEDGQYYAVKKSKYLFRNEFYRQERLEEVKRYEEFSEHEHCVTLYKAWQQDDRLYMQMELCRCSLEAYILENKSISETRIWSILLDLLLALKSLHDKNLIHLDIKLDNILITDDETCKLGDFGLVIDLNRKNLHLATEGDSRYIAPELMRGDFSKAADIFSLGIAILELACNLELPPNGPLWQQLRSGIFPIELSQLLSTELQSVIKSMMSPEPGKRPTVDTLLLHPRISRLLYKRQSQWVNFKRIRNTIKTFTRFVFNKMCNFKLLIYRFLLLQQKTIQPEIHLSGIENKISSTPYTEKQEDLYFGKDSTPDFFIVNSTPNNHYGLGIRKNRKDLTRSQLNFDSSEEDSMNDYFITSPTSNSYNDEATPIKCKKLFNTSEEFE